MNTLILLSLFLSSSVNGLYEDQIGRFDWKREYVGKVVFACVEKVSSTGRSVVVGTEENVIASISLKTGSLLWRQVLEKPLVKKLNYLAITPDHEVLSIQGDLIRTWDPSTGTIKSEVQFLHVPNKSVANSFLLFSNNVVGIVEILHGGYLSAITFSSKTGKLVSSKKENLDWLKPSTKCTTSQEYFICYNENNSSIMYFSIHDALFKEYHVQFDNLENTNVHRFSAIYGSAKDSYIALKTLKNGLVLKISENEVSVMQTVFTSAHAFSIAEVDEQVLLFLRDRNEITVVDLISNKAMKDLDMHLEKNEHQGSNVMVWAFTFARKEGGYTSRILVTSEDHSLSLFASTGKSLWTREEALASIIKVEMVDLPMSPSDVVVEREFEGAGGILAMFMLRLNMQILQLQKGVFSYLGFGDYMGVSHSKVDLTRDEFNLQRMIVAVTSSGKAFGLYNKDGKILWQFCTKNFEPFKRFDQERLQLYVQRNTKHYPYPPLCLLIGKSKVDSNGILIPFNPITGDVGSVIYLDKPILQTALVHHVNSEFMHPVLLILDGTNELYVYPKTATEFVHGFKNQFYLFTSDVALGTIDGYTLRPSTPQVLKLEKTWVVNIPSINQHITHIVSKSSFEKVHSQGRVMGDRGVLYKYLNPNLIAVASEGSDPVHKYFINLYLIDGITGEIVFSANHKRMKGPIHIIHSENWVVYSMYNDKARRYEIASVELYEGETQYNSTAFSSLSSINPVLVEMQAFIFPSSITAMCDTVTEKGITNKHLLIGLPTGGVLELPRAYLDPRRPLVPTTEHRDEGLLPYVPEIPIHSEALVNYYQLLQRINGIFTSSSGLESTSLVFIYGLDLFYTQVSPSKNFDVLKDDFDHYFICVVLGGLCLASYVTKMLASRKALKQAWK